MSELSRQGGRIQSDVDVEPLQGNEAPGTEAGAENAQAAQFQQAETGAETVHTVAAGDSLSQIAQDYGVAGGYQALAAHNNISDPTQIAVGQKIRIPEGSSGSGNSGTQSADGIDWQPGKWTITHYTFAREDDEKHKDSELVTAPGLDPNEKYKKSFLGSPYGIKMQGTGLAENGKYIMYVGNNRYAYGIGGAKGTPESWGSIAVDPSVIPYGSQVVIETYADKGAFVASDTGGAIKGRHIDVFVGPVTIAEAYALGTKKSRVGIKQ